jgi:phage gp36-like protein
MAINLTTISSAVAGYYAAQADVENKFGANNVARWSQLDNSSSSADEGRISSALQYADATIDGFFRDGPYVTPLVLSSGGALAVNWAATIAGVWLYGNRGQRDQDKDASKYTAMLAGVMREMGMYKGGVLRLDAARRWPAPTGPAATGPGGMGPRAA